jgi:hypothetical protein
MSKYVIIQIVGWLAFAVNLWGNELLVKKRTLGWPVRLAANAAWLLYSFGVFAWPLFINHIVFSVSNVHGWVRWRRRPPTIEPAACACAGCHSNATKGT